MYVYPTRAPGSDDLLTVETMTVPAPWHHFIRLLLETGHLVPLREYNADYLAISTSEVLARLQAGDASWEHLVPPAVAETIKAGALFGYRPPVA